MSEEEGELEGDLNPIVARLLLTILYAFLGIQLYQFLAPFFGTGSEQSVSIASSVKKSLGAMPFAQATFLGLFLISWFVGTNAVTAIHFRRNGKSFWAGFTKAAVPFKEYSASDWILLAVVVLVSATFGVLGLLAGE